MGRMGWRGYRSNPIPVSAKGETLRREMRERLIPLKFLKITFSAEPFHSTHYSKQWF